MPPCYNQVTVVIEMFYDIKNISVEIHATMLQSGDGRD
jgi:hypothetical protein